MNILDNIRNLMIESKNLIIKKRVDVFLMLGISNFQVFLFISRRTKYINIIKMALKEFLKEVHHTFNPIRD